MAGMQRSERFGRSLVDAWSWARALIFIGRRTPELPKVAHDSSQPDQEPTQATFSRHAWSGLIVHTAQLATV
eukprot:SAG11_NODE_1116_length_5800_cov_21.451149_5_plen_72_part_00